MFFEGPAGTWAHQDSYYQDRAAGLGGEVAGWFALEAIDAGAGRFFVCPGSHRSLQVIRNEGRLNVADGHESYKQAVAEAISANGLPVCAPYMAKGDVLFWSSLTIHGSLTASRRNVSRASLTAHYLRESDNVLQFHSWIRTHETTSHNGMTIGMLHDQDQWKNRLVGQVRFWFPGVYLVARRLALKTVIGLEDSY
jgi:phytanoyl-CoA hydroxylase